MIRKIIKNLSNLPGWRTSKKIIVIESDDWGSIRMPSYEAKKNLISQNVSMGKKERQRYTDCDTLASKEDLSTLFEVLASFKDSYDNTPVFTVVSVVANPDFNKIQQSNYEEYFYEPFTTTLNTYNLEGAFEMWKEGVENKLFVPQFHGREHLNVQVWMRHLKKGDGDTMKAFKQDCWGFGNTNHRNIDYQAAFDLEFNSDLKYQENVIKEGLLLFEKIHGYKSDFFVPPNGPFNNTLEEVSSRGGIKYMSASKIQREPYGEGVLKRKLHWLGQKNEFNQLYITRNCFFEPSDRSKDWVSSCLNDIENAFRWHKPAVISSHRVNYIGGLDEKNRTHGLNQLTILLTEIQKKWPSVEFMTSSQLGDLISKK
jgi:hypothetical protein